MRHAKKALGVGADGLMLTCSGAGGHAVHKLFDGPLIVAGSIADGHGDAAVLALGADIVCMGTRFIATPESGVPNGHRTMITESDLVDQLAEEFETTHPAQDWRAQLASL